MPRKSKKFIEKKSATTFLLVHRSQKDANKDSEEHTDLVLRPLLRNDQVSRKKILTHLATGTAISIHNCVSNMLIHL